MERAKGGNGIIQLDGRYIGIDLGYDGCWEHEFGGIYGIRKGFGIPVEGQYGFEARKITQLPIGLHYNRLKDTSYLILHEGLSKDWVYRKGVMHYENVTQKQKEARLESILSRILSPVGNDSHHFSSAWDDEYFAVHAINSEYGEIMEMLEDAFLTNDVVIDDFSKLAMGWGLLIYSRIPEQLKKQFADAERRRLART